MEQTEGKVIVDFLDADNWDCIRNIEVDKQNGLIWFYWQLSSGNPVEEEMRKMVFPLEYYGMCLKFDNVRFLRGKRNRCFGIVVNGYTIREKNVKGFAKNGGWNIIGMDTTNSFFSTSVIREKDGVFQHWRFMNTPISSFWIIPKSLNVHPQDSKKLLYMFGVEKCEYELRGAINRIKGVNKLRKERQREEIKVSANNMRTVAESLFKLILCFHQEVYQNDVKDYDEWMLGKLTGPLKINIYKLDYEKNMIDEIPRIANDLSHDSGNPVNFKDLSTLFTDISYFINDFKSKIKQKEHEIKAMQSDKPSPHDFIQEKYKSICFAEDINEIVHKNVGKISFKIKARIGTFIDFFSERGDEVLCKDGYIRNSKKEGIEPLKIWDREEVITLLDKMYQKVIAECEANGYDTVSYSLGISFEAILKKEGAPRHLFTESEIEDLMRNADDNNFNKLVIDEDGYAHIIQNPEQGLLYPVTQETWAVGNMYVGKNSSLHDLHDSYVLCMHLWLAYLETGRQMYDDVYRPDDNIDKVIEEVLKHYPRL